MNLPDQPCPSPVVSRVGITRLTIADFRNYPGLRIEPDLRPVVLTGNNGAGKTNLLEAVSFLAPGRGLRRARLSEVTSRQSPQGATGSWSVAAVIQTADGPVEIGTGRAAGEADRRLLKINGRTARGQGELGNHVSLIWLTPAMDRLFTESAAGRRRFLDRLVYGLDPEHASRLSAFEQAARQRSRLLRDGIHDRTWYTVLEETMARQGTAAAVSRRELVSRLAAALEMAEGPFPAASIELHGLVESWLQDSPPPEVEERYRQHLASQRPREQGGAPTDGPHRSDLAVFHRQREMPAALCSTGEQKALLIALLLAQARVQTESRGMPPLLLLDEVAAHLDAPRRVALFDILSSAGAQAWLTGTERSLFDGFGERAQFLDIRDGCLD